MTDDKQKPEWVCMKCAEAYAQGREGSFCPRHPDEPLLDGHRDEVKFEMMQADDKARSRMYGFWLLTLGTVGLVAGSMIGFYIDVLFDWRMEITLGGVFGGTALGGILAKAMYKRKFARWTEAVDPGGEPQEPWPSL